MRDANGRSRCFAFLTFEDPASVNAVMVREHVLDGKIVRVINDYIYLSSYSFLNANVCRSILRGQSPGWNINARRSYLLEGLQRP